MEKKTIHALAIGTTMHTTSEETDAFVYKDEWHSIPGKWVCDRVNKNGFYFDNKEDVEALCGKVTEYAKELYKEYLKSKEKTK